MGVAWRQTLQLGLWDHKFSTWALGMGFGHPELHNPFVWWAHVHALADSTPERESADFTASRGHPWCLRPAGRVQWESGSNQAP